MSVNSSNPLTTSLAQYHAYLILLTPHNTFNALPVAPQLAFIKQSISLILKGYSHKLVHLYASHNLFQDLPKINTADTASKPQKQISTLVSEISHRISSHIDQDPIYQSLTHPQKSEISKTHLLLLAIALGQCFTQLNFTGPSIPEISQILSFFINDPNGKQQNFLLALELEGLTPYQLCDTPALLSLSLAIFEHLQNLHIIDPQDDSQYLSVEQYTEKTENFIECTVFPNNYSNCSSSLVASCWWRSRFLQIQQSLFFQNSSILNSITSVLLNVKILEFFILNTEPLKNSLLEQQLAITFNLENSRNSYHAELENLTINFLEDSKKLSNLQFILTGALAKLTKYQEKSTASLVILAKSSLPKLLTDDNDDDLQTVQQENLIETHQLNSDLLLEVPTYEKLDNQIVNDFLAREDLTTTGNAFKKIKLSNFKELDETHETEDSRLSKQQKLLPIAMNLDKIPNDLKSLNPNEQPFLNDLDSAQLLLTVLTIKQTSPSGNHLVEEELSALISRIIANNNNVATDGKHTVNWLIFSKSLWERSLIESNKAKTIERGIFQMQALIEELNSKIQTRLFTTTSEDSQEEKEICSSAERLRYLNVIPLAPRWDLEVKLAQKFMTLGIMKSALEIFERLEMVAETALCYASFGDASKAEKILRKRLADNPNDARCISILGDLTADPELWEKAWSLSKYQNAKVSLSKYYYSKKNQDTKKFMGLAMDHIYDVLRINPLSFSNWYYYGCLALESGNFATAAEAFTRCVSLDDTHSHSWSNLGTSLLNLDKSKQALNAFSNAIKTSDATNWRIWENYQMAAVRSGDWIQVIRASKTLIEFKNDEKSINLKIVNALANQLISEPYEESSLTFFQRSTIDYICNEIPKVITKNSQLWKIQSRVELWRKNPWNSLSCMEKAFRIELNNEKVSYDESAWNAAVDSCLDLLASYESLGELPGKHGADDLVCKDWKFKARSTVRSLMGKGKLTWADSDGWNRLVEAKQDL